MVGIPTFVERFQKAVEGVSVPFKAPAIDSFLRAHAKRKEIKYPLRSRQTIYSWIKGDLEPSTPYLLFLAEALNVDATWLGSGKGSQERLQAENNNEPSIPKSFDDKALKAELLMHWDSLSSMIKEAIVVIARDRVSARETEKALRKMLGAKKIKTRETI